MNRTEALKYEHAIRYNLTNGIHKEACDLAFAALREQDNAQKVRVATQPNALEWISVKERLPEEWKTVLVFKPSIDAIIPAKLRGGSWYSTWDTTRLKYVSHWMPMPSPPEGGAEG